MPLTKPIRYYSKTLPITGIFFLVWLPGSKMQSGHIYYGHQKAQGLKRKNTPEALNNPLKYTDPEGEFAHLIVGAAIGGISNWLANGAEFSWEGLGYFGIGTGAGALSAGIGAGIGGLAAVSGSFSMLAGNGLAVGGVGPGMAVGASSGLTNGFVTGTGNSLMEGNDLDRL